MSCEHLETSFSRTISDCGWMHTICEDCEKILDSCGCELDGEIE